MFRIGEVPAIIPPWVPFRMPTPAMTLPTFCVPHLDSFVERLYD